MKKGSSPKHSRATSIRSLSVIASFSSSAPSLGYGELESLLTSSVTSGTQFASIPKMDLLLMILLMVVLKKSGRSLGLLGA